MTVTVNPLSKTGAVALQAHITTLTALPATAHNVQLLKQKQEELVLSLIAEGHLNAANIISTLPVANKSNALYGAINQQAALVTKYGPTPPAYAAALEKDRLERQLVAEEFQQRTAASILSSMSYVG